MPSGQQQILFQRHFDGHHIETAQKIVELWQSQLTREESGWIINWPLTFKLPHLGQRGRLLKFLWKLKDYSKREIVFWAQLLRSGAPDCHWIGLAAQWAVPPDGDWLCPPSVHSGDGCPWEEVAVKLSEVGIDALARQGGRHRAWWWHRRFWCTLKTVWRWSLSLVVSSSCEVSFCCNAMWCWWTRMSCDVMLAFAGMLCNVMLMNVLNGYEWYAMEVYLLCSEWSIRSNLIDPKFKGHQNSMVDCIWQIYGWKQTIGKSGLSDCLLVLWFFWEAFCITKQTQTHSTSKWHSDFTTSQYARA